MDPFPVSSLGSGARLKRFAILILLGINLSPGWVFGQAALTDADVIAAINHALTGKRHQIGLTLNDVQRNVLSGLACETCKTSGYTIFVYTPESWIELQAVQARREMLPFGLNDVSPEMRLPYIHVLASPSSPEYLNAAGMAMASSVQRVVLSSTDRGDVVQPLSESRSSVENDSALRSFAQASAGAVFSMQEVARLRSEDPKGEFFIVVVGDNQNKYFKVKTKFFNQLFGKTSEVENAGRSITPSGAATTSNTKAENTFIAGRPSAGLEGPSTGMERQQRATAEDNHPSSGEGMPPAETPKAAQSVVKLDSTAGAVTHSASTKLDSNELTRKPKKVTERVTNNAYQDDEALIAKWWNLPNPNANSDSEPTAPAILPQRTANSDDRSMAREGSIGAWSDEKPRTQHDGVRVDHIAPDGPADQAGLEVGDFVLAIDDKYVFTAEELTNMMHRCKPGTKVSLRYRRYSTIYDTFVIIGK